MKTLSPSVVRFLRSPKKTIPLILVVIVATIATSTAISVLLSRTTHFYVSSLGTIKTLGVEAYWDPNLENKTEVLNWGNITTGTSKNATLYIRSISNIDTILYLNATNWNPAILSEYMTLSWNYNGTTVHPSEIIQITLTLRRLPQFHSLATSSIMR